MMTPSEKYIAHLCRISFLPFWSFPNPIGKNGKELCDLLVKNRHTEEISFCNSTQVLFNI